MQRSFLDVVDYADAANPTVRKPVNIPGALKGVAAPGRVALHRRRTLDQPHKLLLGRHRIPGRERFDGVRAHLVDFARAFGDLAPPRPGEGDKTVYVAHPAETSNGLNRLEAWTLSDAGRFIKLGETDLSGAAQNFAPFGGFLAAQSLAGVSLFDATDPATLRFLNTTVASGCIWFDLSQADGALDRGLWMPLGVYGVAMVPTSP